MSLQTNESPDQTEGDMNEISNLMYRYGIENFCALCATVCGRNTAVAGEDEEMWLWYENEFQRLHYKDAVK
jgi:hypothetical protein